MSLAHDMRSEKGRAGLSQRLKERGHVVVVGKVTKVDDGGMYVRRASLDELKNATRREVA